MHDTVAAPGRSVDARFIACPGGGVMPDGSAARPERASDTRPFALTVPAHFVYAGRVGGAEHMFYNLMLGMAQAGAGLTLLCGSVANLQPSFVERLTQASGARILERGGRGSRFVAEQRACLGRDIAGDAILFPNYYVPPYLPRRLGRVIAVLHDMQYRHFRANFSEKKRLWLRLAHHLAVRRVDRLVVISESVRQDAARFLGARWAEKLAVVPNPISWQRFADGGEPRLLDRPYVLSVAAHYAHKNLDVLLEAFAALAPRHRDVMLVLCGQDYAALRGVSGRRQTLSEQAARLGIAERVHITGYVDDATLGTWYRHATAFAFPSLFEGFGMPPVEALGFGLPTVISARTALPDVTLGLAVSVEDATSAGAWAERLNEVLDAPACHQPTREQSASLRSYYAPARIGRRYLEVCGGRGGGPQDQG